MKHLTTEDHQDLDSSLDDDLDSEYVALLDKLFGEGKLQITCHHPERVELCDVCTGAVCEVVSKFIIGTEDLETYKPKNILKGIEEYKENKKKEL